MSNSRPGRMPGGVRGPGPMGGGGPGGFAAMGSRAKNFKGTMRQLFSYLKPFRFTIVIVWVLALASTVFTIIGPRIMGLITDELVAGVFRGSSPGTGGGSHLIKLPPYSLPFSSFI